MYGTVFSVVTAPSVNSFENRLDKHWASQRTYIRLGSRIIRNRE